MSILTPQDVVRQLSDLGRELDTVVKVLRTVDLDCVTKRHAANIAESRAFVEAEGSMDLRKHLSRLAASDKESDALVAEALVRHLRATIRAIEQRIEIGRSYGAAVRAELRALPGVEG